MNKVNLFVITLVTAVLLSIAALSQIASIVSNAHQITPTISLEEKQACITIFYDEVNKVNDYCVRYYNYTSCLNSSGPNTDCSLRREIINYTCGIRDVAVTKNKTECKPNNEFIISIDKGTAVLKKQIDSSDWGPCIYNAENSCLIVTCVSRYDGAHKGQFTDCRGGKSCQRFEICDNSIRALYKNSREDFVEDDPSFYLNKLGILEVAE